MPKWLKTLIAVFLLPACIGATDALARVLRAGGGADIVWVPLVCGAACWLVIYLLLPRPMWLYVFGHELTHALWTWVFGGRVSRFRVTASGGHVTVSKTNWVITLSPYFFPLYALLVVGFFLLGRWLWNWQPPLPWFHLFLGAAYAFHVTLTWHVLQTRQPDIVEQGFFFSAVIIWLGNVGFLVVALPLLTDIDLSTALRWWLDGTRDVLDALLHLGRRRLH